MLIKMVGSALLVAGGAGVGIYYGMQPQLRSKQLGEIEKGLMVMYSETEYGRTCLEPMCIKAGKIMKDGDENIFSNFAARLSEKQGENIAEIWTHVIYNEDKCYLTKNDIYTIAELGNYLGCGDVKRQLNGIKMLLNYIEQCKADLKEESAKEMRLWRSTGILAALFVVILLF